MLKFLFMLYRVLDFFLEILPVTKVQKNRFPKVLYFYGILFFYQSFPKVFTLYILVHGCHYKIFRINLGLMDKDDSGTTTYRNSFWSALYKSQ